MKLINSHMHDNCEAAEDDAAISTFYDDTRAILLI